MKYSLFLPILLLLFASSVIAEPIVFISPGKSRVEVGNTFSVDIVMSDFPDSQGGGVTLRFKPSIVQVNKVTVNSAAWGFATRDGVIDNQRGRVQDILFSSYPGTSGGGVIATVELEAISAGRTGLRLQEAQVGEFASQGQPLLVNFQKGKLVVRAVKPTKNKRHILERK